MAREGMLKRQEEDWKDVVRANIRLVLFLRQQGIAVPGSTELKQRYPLKEYD